MHRLMILLDLYVKNICLNNWDNNNDGELSYDEAANVPTIGLIFSGNKNIQNLMSFNILQE